MPAAKGSMLSLGDEHMMYVGPMGLLTMHALGAAVLLTGVDGTFGFRAPGTPWTECRGAFIPAGVEHEMDFRGGRMAAVAIEPRGDRQRTFLTRFRDMVSNGGAILAQRVDGEVPRAIEEGGCRVDEAWQWFCEWMNPRVCDRPSLDARVMTVIAGLHADPLDTSSADAWAQSVGLSESRFLHLFVQSTGVPFRRFRLWTRLRAAVDAGLRGRSFTDAAIDSGFSDSAHFSRTFRDMLGVTPSSVMSSVSRVARVPNAMSMR